MNLTGVERFRFGLLIGVSHHQTGGLGLFRRHADPKHPLDSAGQWGGAGMCWQWSIGSNPGGPPGPDVARGQRFCSMEVIRRQAAFAQEKGLFKAARAWHVSANFVGWKCAETSCSTLPQVSEVDFFISHSWACPSWKKFLAACFHLNLDAAIVLSNLTCFGGVLILRAHAGSFVGIASACQGWLQSALMFYPMGVFLATFFFGCLPD